jgi:hypothetical protein
VPADQQFCGRRPLISVVLAVGMVEKFLPGCLASILASRIPAFPDVSGHLAAASRDDHVKSLLP